MSVKLSQVPVGQAVTFTYKGEKDVTARLRCAEVLEQGSGYVKALDKESGGIREFKDDRAQVIAHSLSLLKNHGSLEVSGNVVTFVNKLDQSLKVKVTDKGLDLSVHHKNGSASRVVDTVEQLLKEVADHYGYKLVK